VVAAAHPEKVVAGLAMLADGGNAIDAVVAAAFTAYIVEPAMCGIGGCGRLSIFLAAPGELMSVDHCAPSAARPDMFEIDESKGLKYYETTYMRFAENYEAIREKPELVALFLPDGHLPRAPVQILAGDRLRFDELA
jgi:hypothetical protein